MDSIVDYKSDKYHQDRHPEFLQSDILTNAWSEFVFLEYFNGKYPQNILEFGGGLGNNLIHVAKKSNVWMIEPSAIGKSFAEKFAIKTASSIDELKQLTSVQFDLILCRHVLEHVDNPLQILIELKSLLRPNGEFLLILPVEKKKEPVNDEIDFHLYCWTPGTAVNLLKRAGFGNIEWRYNCFTGKRIFLPVYKLFGVKYYRLLMKMAGWTFNAKELLLNSRN